MPALQQVALAVAVAVPVLVIVALNVYLFLIGERETLLVPGPDRYPTIALDPQPAPAQMEDQLPELEPLRKAA